MRKLVIVPAYNEEESLPTVLDDLAREAPDFDVVVVNDCSQDATSAIARSRGCHVLDLSFNLGIGGAVQAGFRFALERDYDVAVQVDGDGQHPAAEVPRLAAPILEDGYDMVIGSRYLGDGDYEGGRARRIGTGFLSAVCSALTHCRITDSTSGFRAYSRRALSYLAHYYPTDYPEPESIVLLFRRGMRVREVPVEMRPRYAGQSSIRGLGPVYYIVKVTLALLVDALRKDNWNPARSR